MDMLPQDLYRPSRRERHGSGAAVRTRVYPAVVTLTGASTYGAYQMLQAWCASASMTLLQGLDDFLRDWAGSRLQSLRCWCLEVARPVLALGTRRSPRW